MGASGINAVFALRTEPIRNDGTFLTCLRNAAFKLHLYLVGRSGAGECDL